MSTETLEIINWRGPRRDANVDNYALQRFSKELRTHENETIVCNSSMWQGAQERYTQQCTQAAIQRSVF